jgi:poly(hydroxyalkanoate) depolymerase family esterase
MFNAFQWMYLDLAQSWPLGGVLFDSGKQVHDKQSGTDKSGQFITCSYSNRYGTLGYKLYIPSGYHGQPLPLLVMLHGCTQNADDFAAGTRMNELAEERNCFVAYPEQSSLANGSRCWNWFKAGNQKRGRGEPSLIAGMVRHLFNDYCIERSQVFIAGLSAGGAMSIIMCKTYPELFAAVGIHSGLPYGSAVDLASANEVMVNGTGRNGRIATRTATPGNKRIPIILFHGDRDKTVHPTNAGEIITQCVENAIADSGASLRETRARRLVKRGRAKGHDYTVTLHQDEEGGLIAEEWIIHGAGHAWSGGSHRGSYTNPQGPDAGVEMMRFFLLSRCSRRKTANKAAKGEAFTPSSPAPAAP